MRPTVSLVLFSLLLGFGCATEPEEQTLSSEHPAAYLHGWHDTLTDVMVESYESPPVASRMYVYPHLAAYEVLAHLDPAFRPLAGQLPNLDETPAPTTVVDPTLASSIAFSRTAQALVDDPTALAAREAAQLDAAREALPRRRVDASVRYGEAMAETVVAYTRTDNYAATRSMPRYTLVADDPGRWQPTPPDHHEALEPNWNALRPFTLTSADEFQPAPPTPFDEDRTSDFYRELMEVYDAVNNATEEHIEIAKFWDCNPLISQHTGHFVTFTKKITPGGHWMGIAGLAARKEGLDAMRTSEAYTLTALALADGFISCWDEKYRSCLIRPETVINREIDPNWKPILQTPPFPEYTSGHSVVSGAASTVLTSLFGEPFAFADSTEVDFGLPVRSFASFREAADEAAISRLYGGIHYRPAIENGVAQGRSIGQRVAERIETRARPAVAANE